MNNDVNSDVKAHWGQVPFVHFKVRELGDWVETNTDTYFKNKRVIVFSLPGAFTPTCSNQQLPGYEKQASVFKEHGIDEIYCMSVNDSFVMNAWARALRLQKVKLIPDGSGAFTRSLGMLVNKPAQGFGLRSWRYSAYVDDREIVKFFEEPGLNELSTDEDPYEVSDPETMLRYLGGR